MTIITIDGNIGSGKTSVLTYLHKFHKFSIDLEPVESWNKYLEKMYKDNDGVFNFQVRIWLDRCWVQEKTEKNTILMERSPYFIKNTFINIALKNNMISEKEYKVLMELHKKTDSLWNCTKYIYLQSDPSNCYQRIKKRGRASEGTITETYVNELHDFHEQTYNLAKESGLNIGVINVDNKSISDIANEILEFIKN